MNQGINCSNVSGRRRQRPRLCQHWTRPLTSAEKLLNGMKEPSNMLPGEQGGAHFSFSLPLIVEV